MVMLEGRQIFFNPEQPEKASFPIVFNKLPSSNCTSVRLMQFKKVLFPIVVMLAGIVIVFKYIQSANA